MSGSVFFFFFDEFMLHSLFIFSKIDLNYLSKYILFHAHYNKIVPMWIFVTCFAQLQSHIKTNQVIHVAGQ